MKWLLRNPLEVHNDPARSILTHPWEIRRRHSIHSDRLGSEASALKNCALSDCLTRIETLEPNMASTRSIPYEHSMRSTDGATTTSSQLERWCVDTRSTYYRISIARHLRSLERESAITSLSTKAAQISIGCVYLRTVKPLDLWSTRRPVTTRRHAVLDPIHTFPHAVQILLIASVSPTSFVSNSYNPTATVNVAALNPHQKRTLVLGNRLFGM